MRDEDIRVYSPRSQLSALVTQSKKAGTYQRQPSIPRRCLILRNRFPAPKGDPLASLPIHLHLVNF